MEKNFTENPIHFLPKNIYFYLKIMSTFYVHGNKYIFFFIYIYVRVLNSQVL